MPEQRSRTLLWILIGGGAFFLFVLAVFSLVYLTLHAGTTDAGFSGFGDRIGVVDLEGVILSPQPVVGQLKKFADDSSIKAIILHVNSPGGGVAASEEIYREVKRIREEKRNVGWTEHGARREDTGPQGTLRHAHEPIGREEFVSAARTGLLLFKDKHIRVEHQRPRHFFYHDHR